MSQNKFYGTDHFSKKFIFLYRRHQSFSPTINRQSQLRITPNSMHTLNISISPLIFYETMYKRGLSTYTTSTPTSISRTFLPSHFENRHMKISLMNWG